MLQIINISPKTSKADRGNTAITGAVVVWPIEVSENREGFTFHTPYRVSYHSAIIPARSDENTGEELLDFLLTTVLECGEGRGGNLVCMIILISISLTAHSSNI